MNILKDQAIGKQLAKYAQEGVDGDAGGAPIMVVPVAASPTTHGIVRIPALSAVSSGLHICVFIDIYCKGNTRISWSRQPLSTYNERSDL